MREHTRWRAIGACIVVLVLVSGIIVSGTQQQDSARILFSGTGTPQELMPEEWREVQATDCTYLKDPTEFLVKAIDRYEFRSAVTGRLAAFAADDPLASAATTVDANSIPRRNLIDNNIFDRMAAA